MADSTTLDEQAARRLERKASRVIATIDGTSAALAAAVRGARGDIRMIGEQRALTVEAKLERADARRAQLKSDVDAIEARVLQAEQEVHALVAAALAPGDDPRAELLHEQRLTRTWQRIVRLLDAGGEPLDIAHRALEASDRIVFAALRAELPDYLRATGREGEVSATMAELEAIEAPLLTAVEAAGRQALEEVQRALRDARTAIGIVLLDGETADFIPGPTGGENIDLGAAA